MSLKDITASLWMTYGAEPKPLLCLDIYPPASGKHMDSERFAYVRSTLERDLGATLSGGSLVGEPRVNSLGNTKFTIPAEKAGAVHRWLENGGIEVKIRDGFDFNFLGADREGAITPPSMPPNEYFRQLLEGKDKPESKPQTVEEFLAVKLEEYRTPEFADGLASGRYPVLEHSDQGVFRRPKPYYDGALMFEMPYRNEGEQAFAKEVFDWLVAYSKAPADDDEGITRFSNRDMSAYAYRGDSIAFRLDREFVPKLDAELFKPQPRVSGSAAGNQADLVKA